MIGEHTSKASRLSARRVRLVGAVLAVAGLAFLTASAISARMGATAAAKTITVKIRDRSFALSTKKAPAGKVTFVVTNLGKSAHDFSVGGKKTPALGHGKKARLVVTFKKAGRFTYRSTLKGDAKLPKKGVFVVTAPPKPAVPGNVVAGKARFKTTCAVCHTLEAAGATGTIGPDLDKLKLPYATIVTTVTKGKTGSIGTMPPFGGTLTKAQIQDVAAFVYTSEHS